MLRTNRFLPEDQAAYYEITNILNQGGRNPCLVLDFEPKKNLNRDFVRFGTESRYQIAARHGLQVVRGKVPVPDLRIEYETRDGEAAVSSWNR